jgi:serine/threonine protein phosphatase PrpC
MSRGWAGPSWGEPSTASQSPVPLRATASAGTACYRADGGWSEEFVVMAASVAGVAHRLAGRRCEDAFGWASPASGKLALVIADGVSTAGRGGEGADIAVSAVCSFLMGRPGVEGNGVEGNGVEGNGAEANGWGEKEGQAALRTASTELVRIGGPVASELSTTLVVALVSADGGQADVALARVGDTSAFLLQGRHGGTRWRELFPHPGDEDFRGLPVEVLPWRDGAGLGPIETATVTMTPGDALVLLTDGVADPLREGPGTVAPALAEVLSGGPTGALAPLDLAYAADFSRRGCQDDRTVVAAWALVDDQRERTT